VIKRSTSESSSLFRLTPLKPFSSFGIFSSRLMLLWHVYYKEDTADYYILLYISNVFFLDLSLFYYGTCITNII
jgi:hypothetical protein